jgi:hypothetical protein
MRRFDFSAPRTEMERRRDYTVSRPVQMIYMAIWGMSITLMLGLGAIAYQVVQLGDKLKGVEELKTFGVNSFVVLGVLSFLLVAFALGLGVYTIVHTHRMVGSAFRIKKVIEDWRSGQTDLKVTLRDGDYFLDVADEVNELLKLAKAGATQAAPEPAAPAPAPEADAAKDEGAA